MRYPELCYPSGRTGRMVAGPASRSVMLAAVALASVVGCGPESLDATEQPGTSVDAVVPAPWADADIGAVGVAGSASQSGGQFAVYGSGADIWGSADAFHYVYQPTSGDTQIVARVTSVLATNPWAKAGVMIRESLTAGSRNAFVALTPSNGVAFQSRASTGGSSVNTNVTGFSAPYWVKLVRTGNQFSAFRSANGTAWTQVGTTRTINMGASAFIGLAATSHDNTRLGSASFTNVSVPTSAADTCEDAVSGNNRADSSRFNLVFLGAGFANNPAFLAAIRRVVDLDGTARAQTGADGLLQTPVFQNARNRFNFLYVTGTQSWSTNPPSFSEVDGALNARLGKVPVCQNLLPNRVVPVLLYRQVVGGVGNYPYGSLARYKVTITDCDGQANCSPSNPREEQSSVHELQHTIGCLADEYGAFGDGSSNATTFQGTLAGNAGNNRNAELQFWLGNSYSACLQNAPWKAQIGNGCGQPGVIDCFKPECINTSTQPPTFNIPFSMGIDLRSDCCLPGKPDCISEIACFQGGLFADKGIFRASAGTILRNVDFPPFTGATYLNPQDVSIINGVLQKGPAVGRHWRLDANFNLDCDMRDPGFVPDL